MANGRVAIRRRARLYKVLRRNDSTSLNNQVMEILRHHFLKNIKCQDFHRAKPGNRFSILKLHRCPAARNHQHRPIGSYGLIIEVYSYDSICPHGHCPLLQLCQCGVFGFSQRSLIRTAPSTEKVGERCLEILHEICADNCLTVHHPNIIPYGMSFNSWCCC